jgi:hypothetical protein
VLFPTAVGRHHHFSPLRTLKAHFYITQNGAGTGTGSSCANAKDASFFNDATNWGRGRPIAPGKTVGLCGTITTPLTAQGDGARGKPITVRFQRGAALSQPVCPTSGCLNLDDHSYITVDGGVNGIIENTDNGTNRGHRRSTSGIEALSCDHCKIRNLTIRNIYVHTGAGSEVGNRENDIRISGTGVSVHDNVMHDSSSALSFLAGTGDSGRFYDNEIYNVDHGFTLAGPNGGSVGNVWFYGNHLHDFAIWDSSSNAYHHDGIHCYTNGTTGMTIRNLYAYNNVFDGNIGNNATTWIFMEGTRQHTACSTPSSHMWFFNNVFHSSGPKPASTSMIETNNGVVFTAHNTEIFNSPRDTRGIGLQAPKGSTVVNNVVGGFNKLITFSRGSGSPAQLDYNAYTFCRPGGGTGASHNCFNGQRSWARYHATNEPHSVARVHSTKVGSNADGVGKNLTSMCKGALVPLCRDIRGALRPRRMGPDAGAFQSETAALTSRGIGSVRIGASQRSVEQFYGKGQPVASRRPIFGAFRVPGARTAKYRRHRGLLKVSYVRGKVTALATTSPFYATVSGLGVGAPAGTVSRGGWRPCGGSLVWRRGGTATVIKIARRRIVALMVSRSASLLCRARP